MEITKNRQEPHQEIARIAFDKKTAAFDTKSIGNCRRSIRNQQEIAAFDKTSVAFDTKTNKNYWKSIRIIQEIAMKSLAFDKKSVAFDTKSRRN